MNTSNQKTKTAYSVRATIEGKIWETKSTTLVSANEVEAKQKAIKILGLSSEHLIAITPVTVYSSESVLISENYPYGSIRTKASFGLEFNKNGFRTIFQTINPKTGRINNPKKSTYSPVILPSEKSNAQFDYCGYCDFNGTEAINRGLHFMNDFYELFTDEQIKQISLYLIGMMKVNTKAQIIYCNTNFEDLKPLIEKQIKIAAKIVNTGENLFLECILDKDKIEALKVPNYNPFTVKQIA